MGSSSLRLVNTQPQQQRELFDYEKEMLDIINRVEEYSWSRGELGGLSFGDQLLDEAFNGVQPAMYIIAGQSNIGKSMLSLRLAWNIAHCNDNAYVIYFAIDDPDIAILPRIIAMDQRIPIDAAKIPERFKDNKIIMAKRAQGLERLRSAVDKFKLLDQKFGNTVESIVSIAQAHKARLEANGINKQVCVFIDNMFDLETEAPIFDTQQKMQYIVKVLDNLCETQLIPVICTGELKKLNGTRRPIQDDIRETVKTQFIASGIMLCYNEVLIKGEQANVYHQVAGVEGKQPVLEVMVSKNKLGEFHGRIFYNMYPAYSYLEPVSKEGAKYYTARIQG